jgi:aryl-alcohol dehydrogenase-like predicted oxidoreductase
MTTMTMTRMLGRSGIEVSALGVGCWAIGGVFWDNGRPLGWGRVDDDESVAALHRALELGVNFFDTANVYGAGHSERVLGRAFAGRRDQVVIATKFGNTFDEDSKEIGEPDGTPAGVRSQLEASLRRLGTDHVDLYQLHINELPVAQALDLVPVLDELVDRGLIRAYGWSTDDPERAAAFATASRNVTATQHDFSVLGDSAGVLAMCEKYDLASINRGPLAMGLLTGKFTAESRLGADDVRGISPDWMVYFRDGRPAPELLARIDSVRDVLRSEGRTLAQGALGYLWARSGRTVPIPGCRTVAQVEENAGALAYGPLTADQAAEVDALLGRKSLDS